MKPDIKIVDDAKRYRLQRPDLWHRSGARYAPWHEPEPQGPPRWLGILMLVGAALCGYGFGKLLEWAL